MGVFDATCVCVLRLVYLWGVGSLGVLLAKGNTEVPSPGVEPGTPVSGAVRRNQVPSLNVGTHWGYISYIYPRTARATGSRSTLSTIGEKVGPRLSRSTTYGCVHYRAHHGDLTTPPPNGHHPINSGQTLATRVIRGGPIACRRFTRKCHHRESNPGPPCPESYAVTKYRA
jgi:hypothetical protein